MTSQSSVPQKLRGDAQPMTPRSCAVGCAIWLVIMAIPPLLFYFANQGQIEWQRGVNNLEVDRIWLVNEARSSGVGYLSARITRTTPTALCVQTHVNYFLWRTTEANQNTTYEQSYIRTGDTLELASNTCP